MLQRRTARGLTGKCITHTGAPPITNHGDGQAAIVTSPHSLLMQTGTPASQATGASDWGVQHPPTASSADPWTDGVCMYDGAEACLCRRDSIGPRACMRKCTARPVLRGVFAGVPSQTPCRPRVPRIRTRHRDRGSAKCPAGYRVVPRGCCAMSEAMPAALTDAADLRTHSGRSIRFQREGATRPVDAGVAAAASDGDPVPGHD